MSNVVGDRFQITIGKDVRDELGVNPGDLAIERVEDGRLVVSFVPRPHRESLLGILRERGIAPIRDWSGVIEDARQARSVDILKSLDGSRSGTRRAPRRDR